MINQTGEGNIYLLCSIIPMPELGCFPASWRAAGDNHLETAVLKSGAWAGLTRLLPTHGFCTDVATAEPQGNVLANKAEQGM